jgi:hypothetical protein
MITGNPELDALLERAYTYREKTYQRLGHLPTRVFVTEHEYDRLLRYHGYGLSRTECFDHDELTLFGMLVVLPKRRAWDGEATSMSHAKRSPRVGSDVYYDPFPSLPDAVTSCRTDQPLSPMREVTCPCGEVIWEMPAEVYWVAQQRAMPLMPCESSPLVIEGPGERLVTVMDRMVEEVLRHTHESTDDPLPPLDDLDEGLHCCGVTYGTFAEFMTHRRQHE